MEMKVIKHCVFVEHCLYLKLYGIVESTYNDKLKISQFVYTNDE